jgi:hypothetical protein
VGGGAAPCSPFVGCRDVLSSPFVGAGVVGVVGHVRGWWGVGHSSPLKGGGGGPSSPFAGGGDVPLLGHRRCGWGPCLSLGGYDAGPSSAVVVGPCLLRCPSLFSLRCPLPFSCRFAVSSFRHVVVSPRRRFATSSFRHVVVSPRRRFATSSFRHVIVISSYHLHHVQYFSVPPQFLQDWSESCRNPQDSAGLQAKVLILVASPAKSCQAWQSSAELGRTGTELGRISAKLEC